MSPTQNEPFVPRLTIATCEDYFVISQALFFLAAEIPNSTLGIWAKDLAHYVDTSEKQIHTVHDEDALKRVQAALSDLINGMPNPEHRRTAILDTSEVMLDKLGLVEGYFPTKDGEPQ